MSDVLTEEPSMTDADEKRIMDELFAEMRELREKMRLDQIEIERLRAETRVIGAHSDRILLQIEAQLDELARSR